MRRVLIVGHHPVMRHVVGRLLAETADLESVGVSGDAREALAMVRRLAPDVVLIDMDLPDSQGVRLARDIARDCAGVRVVALTGGDGVRRILAGRELAPWAWVGKHEPPESLLAAIRGDDS